MGSAIDDAGGLGLDRLIEMRMNRGHGVVEQGPKIVVVIEPTVGIDVELASPQDRQVGIALLDGGDDLAMFEHLVGR